jgi:uncharacterized phage-like protein YoqJ
MIICGTGHRPDKLGGYGEEVHERIITLATHWLVDNIKDPDKDRVVSGGALGWDQALARAARVLGFDYWMYLPFKDFDSKWPIASRDMLAHLCSNARAVKYICEEGYAPWKMQKRNEAMVDAADLVLALWNGTPGGTANCIRYAEKVGKPIVNLWERYEGQRR